MERFDAVVVGLGVYGSAVAYELAARGLRVLGVERSPERVVGGASQGPIRMVRGGTHNGARRGMTRDGPRTGLSREASAWWRGFAAERGPELFRPARELSAPHAIATTSATCSPPWTGLLDAAACVRELRHRAADGGATLWFGCEAEIDDSTSRGNGTEVRAGHHWVRAGLVVSAVGAALRHGPGWLTPRGVTIEHALMQVASWPQPPPEFSPDVFYVLADRGDSFCVVPAGSSTQIQFGHFGAPPVSPGATAETAERAARARDRAALQRFFPALPRPVKIRSVRGGYVFHQAGNFVLTWVRPRIAVVTACAGVGFKFAPILAPQIADIVVRGPAVVGQAEVLAAES